MPMTGDLDILTQPERQIVGTVGSYTMAMRHHIPKQWKAYFDDPPQLPGTVEGAFYGVSFDTDGQGGFHYIVGAEVKGPHLALPPGLERISLSAGLYAVMRRFGPVSDLPDMFDAMFAKSLPRAGYAPQDGPVFERYPSDPRNGPDGMAIEIWAPVDWPN